MASIKPCIQLILFFTLMSGFMFLETIKLISCNGDHNASCMPFEREALLKFKKSLKDPSGRLSSWVGENCCNWSGVFCDNRTGHVIKLNLRNLFRSSLDGADGATYYLGGEINSSLLDLKYLNYLDLSLNNFEGSEIPKFLGSLQKLRYLNLTGASFGGTIPQELGNLSRLIYLDLNTYFNESKKNDLQWLSGLSSLKFLNLGGVDLTNSADKWLQAVNMLPSLLELHLPACGLSKVPLSFPFVNLSSLLVLDLSKNFLYGTIPEAFANLTSLEYLDLSANSYTIGQLPRELGKLCNLRILDLSQNNIEGQINELIDGLSRCNNSSLEILDLGYNQLGGFLPYSLGHLTNLKYLGLRNNFFVGTIPNSIGNLSSLTEFDLSSNQMKGTISESIGKLSALTVLDISENSWMGVVTEAHFLNLTSLKDLSIAKFSLYPILTLVVKVSSLWIPPFKLQYLKLRSCHLGPKFPAWLRTQTELTTLVLRNTQISGTIPEWFWELDLQLDELDFGYNQLTGRVPNSLKFNPQSTVYLKWNSFEGPLPLWSSNVSALYLSHNHFSGPIPVDIGERMPTLTDLDISSNSLNGTIPLSIGKLCELSTLDISSNHLSGKIPGFWNGVPYLYALDISNNSLFGEIPISLGSLSSLQFLILSDNHLSGAIPPTLQNCTNIYRLDIGYNKLSGSFPGWIGESLSSLLILRLRSNLFDGHIPPQICNLSSLHILDLADNNLSGIIPACVGNLSGMATDLDAERYEGELVVVAKGTELFYEHNLYLVNLIDLSSNNLSGEMPEMLPNLSRLGTLNLSANHLTGTIPDSVGILRRVESLDLSRNQLSGIIPPTLTSLTFLNHLNLSYNNLSGKIPSNNQFQTIEDSSYEGNPALCGPPRSNSCNGDNGTSSSPGGTRGNNDGGDDKDGDDFDMVWFYISMGPGFVVGFWGVCGTLLIKKSWREAYFLFVDDIKDRVIVVVSIYLARLRKIMEPQGN